MNAVVKTENGSVCGFLVDGNHVFAGIPYAAAPRGPSRFAPPAPARSWDGVRDASKPGPTAPMGKRAGFGGMDMGSILASGWVRGEDYLTVTVTTPDASAGGLPVLVFVHGGGFTAGAAQAAMYDGTSFARDGGGLGACHCVELPFVFDRTRLAELHGPRSLLGERASAADLAARMHSAWTAFVTTGDPGWKQYGRDGCATMVIDTDWHLESR